MLAPVFRKWLGSFPDDEILSNTASDPAPLGAILDVQAQTVAIPQQDNPSDEPIVLANSQDTPPPEADRAANLTLLDSEGEATGIAEVAEAERVPPSDTPSADDLQVES